MASEADIASEENYRDSLYRGRYRKEWKWFSAESESDLERDKEETWKQQCEFSDDFTFILWLMQAI